MRALTAISLAVALVVPAVATSMAHADDDSTAQAVQEIADARERANAAADALFSAESALDTLDLERIALEQEIVELEAEIAELQATVEAVAVNRYTRSGTSSVPVLNGFRSAGEQAQIDALIEVVNESSAEDFDQFDVLSAQLDDKRGDLRRNAEDGVAARDELDRRRVDALAEVERLKDVEEDRLDDDAVRQALQAEEAERRQQETDFYAAQAELLRAENSAGQTKDAPAPAIAAPGAETDTTDLRAIDGGLLGGDGDIDELAVGTATGGQGGGQTGTTGIGARPGAAPGDLAGEGWLCPVQGPVAFGDTWGAPRSGGRSHQGVDMIGPRGLPIVAVVDGFAQSKVNELGGQTIAFSGVDGNRYYYAHLDGWANLGSVTAGTVIGYLGDTGNAKQSVPHLHFEIHPGGGPAVNPYPTVRAHC